MPKYIPNTQFSDCWSSVGNVTFYHRNGICYFRSKAYSDFAGTADQLENEHIPAPVMFEPFPIFSMDYLNCLTTDGGLLKLRFRLTLCGAGEPERYRVLGKFQIGEPGCGRNPGMMRNCLSKSIPSGECSVIEFLVPDTVPVLQMKQLHLRYLLLDTRTGYRSQYHSMSAIATI